MTLRWADEAELHGIEVRAAFFDGDEADRQTNTVKRILPFLSGNRVRLLFSETDRRNLMLGALIVQPDAVLGLGDGLVNVEYKSRSKRSIDANQWRLEVRLEHMLQCALCGLVLAQTQRRTVANILRYHNAAFFLQPRREVMEIAWSLIGMACAYHGDVRVGAQQLARFASERVRKAFAGPTDPRSSAGRMAHETMFRGAH